MSSIELTFQDESVFRNEIRIYKYLKDVLLIKRNMFAVS